MTDLITRAVAIADNLTPRGGTGNLARARTLSHGLERALDRYRDLDRAIDRDRARSLAVDLDLAPACALARDLGHAGDLDRARLLALDLGRSLARARTGTRSLASELAGALSNSLGIEHVDELAAALLDGALDDFSQADLSGVDLADIGLVGVRWSLSGTNWPPGVDVEALMRQSEETGPGSGIYVITRRGETERITAEVRV
jgi:hypothetical protein